MIRRFNYTNRIRISRSDVQIILDKYHGELWFNADLSKIVTAYELPPEGLVFVEAYRQTNWMRFDYGTVGKLTPASDRILKQFDSSEDIRFRVKVTLSGDGHRLLAEADGIPLISPDEQESGRTSLLPVKPHQLGEQIYQVDFSNEWPRLLVNSEAGNYRDICRHPAFMALAYPAIFREVLTQIIVVGEHDDDADMTDWRSQWIKFAKVLPGVGDLPDVTNEEDSRNWINDAVSAFAKRIGVRGKFDEFWR